jgi:long-chain acyl-CoA synthetase
MTVALPLHGVGEPRPEFATVSAMFDHAVASAGERIALRDGTGAITYGEEGRAASSLSRLLAAQAAPGDVVALLLPNSAAFPIAYFAALKSLTVPALLNPRYPAVQLAPLLRESSPQVIVCAPETRELAQTLAGTQRVPMLICIGGDITLASLAAMPEVPLERPEPRPSDIGAIMFSGGTTGPPKAVEHSHERLMIAVRCVEWNWPTRISGEVWLPIAPFAHIYGFLLGVLAPVFARAEVVIPERFKPELTVELLARHRVTVFGGGPPAIYAGVLSAPNLASADLSSLRVCPAGGAPMPAELHERWRKATGLVIHEGYGMTEMAPISGTTAQMGLRVGSVGKAMPCAQIQIVDIETGMQILPPGAKGEVRVRGPHMMTGYRGRPAETAQILRDGWLYTGDLGHLDADGFLFITDRKKDVVLVNGFNVFPREVEEAIIAHPKVAAIGVVGAPDERSGERVVAYVVPHEGAELIIAEIAAFAAERLASFACPADIRIVDALPMTGAHKLDRMALQRLAAEPFAKGGSHALP